MDDRRGGLASIESETLASGEGADALGGGRGASANAPRSLAEDTMGPYYHYSFLDGDRSDLTVVHPGLIVAPKGERILLRGRLLDSEGDPVADAVLEFWQANAAGVLRTPRTVLDPGLDPHFDGFARLITTGSPFELRTVKPGVGTGEARRAPHVTLTIFSDGVTRLVTQVFFEGEEANAGDPLLRSLPETLRSRLVARRSGVEDGMAVYEIDVVMRGDRETPFFDDLES